jgi:hypothetical protein
MKTTESFWVEENVPDVVWHYTSADGLLGILKDGEIFASDLRFLNDKTENAKMLQLIGERLDERVVCGTHDEFVVECVKNALADTKADAVEHLPALLAADIVKLQELLRKDAARQVFVSCFSAEKDSLSQWRAYSGGNGYCIGFSTDVLSGLAHKTVEDHAKAKLRGEPLCRFEVMRYVPDDNREAVDSLINAMLAHKWAFPAFSGWPTIVLEQFAPFVKDESFREEKEWRLAYTVFLPKRLEIEFRRGRSHLIPFVRVKLRERSPTFIQEIMVGPGPSSDLDMLALQNMVHAKDLPIKITKSAIPFRNW